MCMTLERATRRIRGAWGAKAWVRVFHDEPGWSAVAWGGGIGMSEQHAHAEMYLTESAALAALVEKVEKGGDHAER